MEQAQAEVGDEVVVVATLDAHLAQSIGIAREVEGGDGFGHKSGGTAVGVDDREQRGAAEGAFVGELAPTHTKGVEPDGVDAALSFAHQQVGLINAFDFTFQTERLSVGSASPEYQRQQKAEKIEELHGERGKEEGRCKVEHTLHPPFL